ncbi:MAG: hypothetical protein V4733_07150 [Verrucomicrobiota bacterium]
MKGLFAALLFIFAPVCHAQETAAPAEGKKVVPKVDEAIPASVKGLPPPTFRAFTHGIRIAVTAATDTAQQHVTQGLNHLHGGWEFEAMRHFAAAMREDPDCLLAHWGMVMCMLAPSPETDAARAAAILRMAALVDSGAGTELERGYAYGLIKYKTDGPAAAANAFRKVAERFPNDLQAAIFASLFGRGGYDADGQPTPDESAEHQRLEALVAKHPDDPLPLNALLFVRAEGPDPAASLPLARQLCQLAPDYPPYFHLLGHYAWRAGQHNEAVPAFARASAYYSKWMKENKATFTDCPEWLKSEAYRAVALHSKGDFKSAYAAAQEIAATPLDRERPNSPGMRFLLWDAKTLPARMILTNTPGGPSADVAALPNPQSLTSIHPKSVAYVWIDALRFCLEARKQINAGDHDGARKTIAALTTHGELMAKVRSIANSHGEAASWLRAFRALEVLASELRGAAALIGPKDRRDLAYNWFASAADRQRTASMLFPPLVLTPMARRLGAYYSSLGKTGDAIIAYERALAKFPGDLSTLTDLVTLYRKSGDHAKAAEMEKRIAALKEL